MGSLVVACGIWSLESVVTHKLSCPQYVEFLWPRDHTCISVHWQGDSQSLDYQESLIFLILKLFSTSLISDSLFLLYYLVNIVQCLVEVVIQASLPCFLF